MTNREWLNSLSDEQIADFWYQLIDCEDCPMADDSCANCQTMILKWLRAEHRARDEKRGRRMLNKDYKRLTVYNEELQRPCMTADMGEQTTDTIARHVQRLYELEKAIEDGSLIFVPREEVKE